MLRSVFPTLIVYIGHQSTPFEFSGSSHSLDFTHGPSATRIGAKNGPPMLTEIALSREGSYTFAVNVGVGLSKAISRHDK